MGADRVTMWKHYCYVERAWLNVKNGEPCSACGADEEEETRNPKESEHADRS